MKCLGTSEGVRGSGEAENCTCFQRVQEGNAIKVMTQESCYRPGGALLVTDR